MATDKMKQEALSRMRMLKLQPEIIQEFEENGRLFASIGDGILFDPDEEIDQIVSYFQSEYGYLVYHVIDDLTDAGRLITLLFVSNMEEDWPFDKNDIQDGIPFAYVANLDFPHFSEFGCVGVKPSFGGVKRTA